MNILAAIDQSDYARKVLDTAFSQVENGGGDLTVFTVAPCPARMESLIREGSELDVLMRVAANEVVRDAADQASQRGIEVKTVVEAGHSPALNIVRYAKANATDLIVLGHRGRSAVGTFLLGSVAAYVVTHAPCSVYVVRDCN
jgi:nucleotide-binding universal stress UspA family protein